MGALMMLVFFGPALWMAADASKLGYDAREMRGMAAISPAGWFFAGLLLGVVAFPLYLIKRPELKAAGDARRLRLRGGAMGILPGAIGGYGHYGQQYGQQYPGGHGHFGGQPGGANPYAPSHYGQRPAPAPPPPAVDVADEIIKLAAMRDQGLLTDAEFQQKKSQLLNRG